MRARVLPDAEALADAAAREFVDAAKGDIALRGRFLVALAGGRTPVAMYERLASGPLRDEVDWPRVEFFTGDERAVPQDHPDSNIGMARRTLLDPLGIDTARVHRMRGEAADLDEAARAYEEELLRVAGTPPSLDLVLLGIGADGHTASLFPGMEALSETNRWVVASDGPAPGSRRLTLTFPAILAARRIMVLVSGADKGETVRAVMHGGALRALPAERLHDAGSRVTWLVEAAAARLAFRADQGGHADSAGRQDR